MTARALATFAAEVGPPDAGPVVAEGGRTQWSVGVADAGGAGRAPGRCGRRRAWWRSRPPT